MISRLAVWRAVYCLVLALWSSISLAEAAVEPGGALSLSQAIAAALARNPELQASGYTLRAAEARMLQAGARPNPELEVELENFAGSGAARGTDQLESTLSLSQVIELGGKRARRVAVAESERNAATVARDARQLDVLAEVTRRYVQVVASQELLKLTQRASELAEKSLAAISARVKAARSPEAEQSRASIAAARARLQQQRAAAEHRAARQRLAASWGSTQPAFERVQADVYALTDVASFESLTQRLQRNPDFLRFATESRLREAELRLAQAQARPSLKLTAGVRRLEESGDSAIVAGFSLPLPLFDRNQGAIAEAGARRSLSEAEQQAALIQAQTTLFGLYQQLGAARNAVETLRREALPQAEQALTQTEYGYERGRFSYLELAEAQRELIELQRETLETAADYHRLLAELERLTAEPVALPTGGQS